MFKRRLLAFVCCFCLVCSALCGSVFGAGIDDIYGGNPWEDLEGLPGLDEVFPSNPPVVSDSPDLMEPVVIEPVGEEDLSVFSVNPSQSVYYYIANGVQLGVSSVSYPDSNTYFVDWPGNPTQSTFPSKPLPFNGLLKSGTLKCDQAGTWRYGPVITSSSFFTVGQVTDISAIDTPAIRLSGSVLFYLPYSIYTADKRYLYPTGVQISVNNMPFGDIVTPNEDHSFSFSETTIDISSFGSTKVVNVGFRFYFQEQSRPFSVSFPRYESGRTMPWSCYLFYNDASVQWSFLKEIPNGPSADQSAQQHEETKGLLGSIIQLIQNIVSGITNIGKAIAELPGKIVTALIDGLKSLFVPDEEGLQELMNKYKTLLETKFGFVYQSFEMLEGLFNTVVGAWGDHSDYTFEFPGISFDMQGQTFTLVEPQTINLDNEVMTILRGFAGTVVSLICVLALIHSMETLFIAVVSGKNYFDFLAMQREAEAEVEASQ